jgi:hydroxymethylglutaryl-CoA reductase
MSPGLSFVHFVYVYALLSLQLLGCAGPCQSLPGGHANRLAEVIAVTVMAGELSLMAALVTDELVSSHMKLNRSVKTLIHSSIQMEILQIATGFVSIAFPNWQ